MKATPANKSTANQRKEHPKIVLRVTAESLYYSINWITLFYV